MRQDKIQKILLSAILILLCANLLVALRATPSQAQSGQNNHPRYVITNGWDVQELRGWMNSQAKDGYRFKSMAGDHSSCYIVMEK